MHYTVFRRDGRLNASEEVIQMSGDHSHKRPSARAFFTNWSESALPFTRKLSLTFRNQWIKVRHGQSCCGHEGEPGC